VKFERINKQREIQDDFQVTSYDNTYPGWGCTPDRQFEQLAKLPAVYGEFVWTGFDYIGEPTPYNKDMTNLLNYQDPKMKAKLKKELEELGKIEVPSRSSYFGIMDLCGFKKDRFYNYQAHWRPGFPMAHILPHWNWTGRKGKVTPVHVYTSGDEAELFLNGKSLGRKKKGEYEYRLIWDDVKYVPGKLKVVAYKDGKEWATDEVETTGKAKNIKLTKEVYPVNGKSTLFFVTVDLLDSKGRFVPTADNDLSFELEGDGEIIATGNGDPTCLISFKSHKRPAFNGKCLMIVKMPEERTGKSVLKVKGKGLASKSVEL
jgi:beta-galactosidase